MDRSSARVIALPTIVSSDVPTASWSLGNFAVWCMADDALDKLSPRTVENVRCLLRNPALARLVAMPLREARPIDVQAAMRGLSHYSPRSQRTYRMMLSGLYRRAVDGGLILANPARGLRGPALGLAEHTILTPDQTRGLAEWMLGARCFPPAYAVIGAMIGCGLRIGEARGPRMVDLALDGDRPEWRVAWQATRTGAARVPPKSELGRRVVPMLPVVVDLIRRRLDDHPRPPAGNDWPLGRILARPVACPTINLELRHACRAAGVPIVHAHELRHAYASALAAANVDRVTLAEILGTTIGVADQYYLHALPGSAWAAVDRAFAQ